MQGLEGIKVPVRQSNQVCPIHGTRMVYSDRFPTPFCEKCQLEKTLEEKKKFDQVNSIKIARSNLKRVSLVDNPDEYNHAFDNFEANEGTKEWQMKEAARKLAGKYFKDRTAQFNSIMYGTPGEGKTHLAMAMLNAVNQFSEPPQKCLFINVTSLFLAIRDSFDNPLERWTEKYAVKTLSNADLLVIDDLGSESAMSAKKGEASQFVQRILYQVTNRQHRIIVTTNLTLSELRQTYNPKLISRLLAGSSGSQLDFSGIEDKRY
ncbi:DnaA ATPase domain-containing protein [Lactobacillus crispatus]|uniref:DnaA ATPase domain-containing protein n=1 Tax=Lactobacillus crispatus TaxID=47770 RepID=UPI0022AC557D|nr:ATP-binding protein [Lactobacillus crispatus]MCZ3847164.1 ATP-binding protein [Lactobacillus crispatus]MCZ3849426.1 ATP-binding protein [Lactobacillus crispatus]MCZ3855362.1 ATP-binding protein [Lactobacillus crispatus]MCZ3857545.1 ATP-binding protein [Lactobacillus crispatus]MCZ3859893.1 ATP-binding protein [Lactobacillus crispatus]